MVKQNVQLKSKSFHSNNRTLAFNRHKCRCAYGHQYQQKQQQQQHEQQANQQLNEANDNHGEMNMDCKQKPAPQSVKSKIRNIFTWFNHKKPSSTKFYNNNDRFNNAEDDAENAEIYYFDHGSPLFYRTTDCPPHLISEMIAQRTTYHATRFWAELFGSINIGVTFIVTFFLQFYR